MVTTKWRASTVPEEQFSDIALPRIATYYSERFAVEVDEICQQAFVKAHPKRLFQANLFDQIGNYRRCTVLLVFNNSVSNFTNLYLWNQNEENVHIQTLPSPTPIPLLFGRLPWTLILTTPSLKKILDPPVKRSMKTELLENSLQSGTSVLKTLFSHVRARTDENGTFGKLSPEWNLSFENTVFACTCGQTKTELFQNTAEHTISSTLRNIKNLFKIADGRFPFLSFVRGLKCIYTVLLPISRVK